MSVNREASHRMNMYLSQYLVDNLDILGEQLNVSNNALINTAIGKFLLDMKVIPEFNSKDVDEQKVLKETDYCKLIKQGRLDKGDHVSTIERIYVKEKDDFEIRFAYYKPNKKNNERLILRPLDLNEEDLFEVFCDAIDKEVFSPEFENKLRNKLTLKEENRKIGNR